MASRRKTPKKTAELTGNPDPRTPLDGAALLTEVRPLLKALAADLLKRADDSPGITHALQARHAAENAAERTADAFPEWRRSFVEQVAAAWLLSCVFVRTLEDRQLLGKNRIAGPGALDSWKAFLQLAPSLSEREYLLTVFRELSRFPAAADLFDVRHNPVWLLAPSADGARQLLELFRGPSAEAPTFRFGGADTRFLGDLYQDLSEDVRKRYALLQTPRFVESFILDRTLEPAIERFGLDDTHLIDPTCGSGHFLLGAFERLFDHRLRAEPGLSAREAASKALDAVAGADINPYAIAIARFRLTLAFIEKCGLQKLKDVPRLPLHLAVADSLLYNPQTGQQLGLAPGTDPEKWEGSHFSLEDPAAARDVLFKTYAAVVGNPPYITVKDVVLRERYRSMYASAFRSYSLAVPFTERFFQLARDGGRVGTITANSFMKREFGRLLIEQYLPTIELDLIVNTSGAYIPGHGTPTVLLFGAHAKPTASDVLAVLANRGEPTTPELPENGLVWSSIAAHWNEVGFENEYISVSRVGRATLKAHPWSLGGGGAAELMERLEEGAAMKLGNLTKAIGRSTHTGEDSFFFMPGGAAIRLGISSDRVVTLVTGEQVRDWSIQEDQIALFPYDYETGAAVAPLGREAQAYWTYRSILRDRQDFGQKIEDRGLAWFEHSMFFPERFLNPTSIAFAFVATHNHFVLDRGGKVFKQSAPIIKLPETATEDDHLALLAYLNSSTACFWMKQAMMNKGGSGIGRGVQDEAWEARFEFDGTKLASVPLPHDAGQREQLLLIVKAMMALARHREDCLGAAAVARWKAPGKDLIGELELEERDTLAHMCALQEELDWIYYELFGLLEDAELSQHRHVRAAALSGFPEVIDVEPGAVSRSGLCPGHRPFEVLLHQAATAPGGRHTAWFARNNYASPDTRQGQYAPNYQALLDLRAALIAKNPHLRLVEQPEYKRRWGVRDWKAEFHAACQQYLLQWAEKATTYKPVIQSARGVASIVTSDDRYRAIANLTLAASHDYTSGLNELMAAEAVPFMAGLRYTDSGYEKFSEWEATWDAQRGEDRGEKTTPKVPPKYGREDFASPSYWSLRGKLDVPKERFISYPGCESDEDKEPVYGWAGWDHLQRAVALAGLYQDRKQREGWSKERLLPMLAGLLELLPWLKQWHHEPSADLGGERPSDQFEAFLNAECAEHGFTHDHLRNWRPPAKGRTGFAKPRRKRAGDDEEVSE